MATATVADQPASAVLQLPAFSEQTRLLVIAPHPDDETIAAGLLIQRVLAAGGAVKILLLTAGENNPWPQRWIERRLRISDADRQRWGRRRESELAQALQRLHVPLLCLQTLNWPDMGITAMLLQQPRSAVTMLASVIAEFDPSIVAMPSIDDRHPDHGSTHVLTRLALAGHAGKPLPLSYLIHGSASRYSLAQVSGTTAQLTNKLDALSAYESQMALSRGRMRRLGGRPESYGEVLPATGSVACVLPWQPPRWLHSHLRLSVADCLLAQTWRWSEAPLQRGSDGTYHLAKMADPLDGARFARLSCDLPSPWIFDHWGWREI